MELRNFVISTNTIIKTASLAVILWLCYLIKDILSLLFISFILALAIEPFVDFLVSKKISRGIAVLVSLFFFVSGFLGLASVALAPVVWEFSSLVSKTPEYINSVFSFPGFESYSEQAITSVGNQLSSFTSNIVQITINTFSGFLSLVIVISFTAYILLDFPNIRKGFANYFEKSKRRRIQRLINDIEKKLGAWLRGQIFLMVLVGSITFIGLVVLKVDYALALAVIAGLLELIPIIGPIIATIPAAIVGFVISPAVGFGVIGLYILIQQLENQVFVPKVMQKALGQSPIITILVLLIGGKLLGVVGAILAIPITIIMFEIDKFLKSR